MKLHRTIHLCFWLSTILLMAAGVLAPSVAWAHPGHGEERGQSRLMAFQASFGTTSPDVDEDPANALLQGDDPQAVHPATLAAQPGGERGCAGAACCGTGHGCCVAYLPGWDDSPPAPADNRLAIALGDAPPGRGAPRLPEPPRPFR